MNKNLIWSIGIAVRTVYSFMQQFCGTFSVYYRLKTCQIWGLVIVRVG